MGWVGRGLGARCTTGSGHGAAWWAGRRRSSCCSEWMGGDSMRLQAGCGLLVAKRRRTGARRAAGAWTAVGAAAAVARVRCRPRGAPVVPHTAPRAAQPAVHGQRVSCKRPVGPCIPPPRTCGRSCCLPAPGVLLAPAPPQCQNFRLFYSVSGSAKPRRASWLGQQITVGGLACRCEPLTRPVIKRKKVLEQVRGPGSGRH
jgi:hypothetical protein